MPLLGMHATCPADCKGHLEAIAMAAPTIQHGRIRDIISGVTSAGVPLLTIVAWIAANLPKLLSLLNGPHTIAEIIDLLVSLFKPPVPVTP